MRFQPILIILMSVALILTGCAKTSNEFSSIEVPDEEVSQLKDESLEQCDWTLRVSDTKKGTYDLPIGDKSIDISITLDMVAWKTGGIDIYGSYEGEAYLTFEFNESKLSSQEIMYIGGGVFDRKCEKLKFDIMQYDLEEYKKHIPSIPGQTSIAPFGDFNAMATFQSDWTTVLRLDQQVIDRDSGKTLADTEGDFSDGGNVPMGINVLIDGGSVTVDIPTYKAMWNIDYFRGTITGDSMGTVHREKLENPYAQEASNNDIASNSNLPASDKDDNSKEEYTNYMEEIEFLDGEGRVITDKNGGYGIDKDNDGDIDIFWLEGGSIGFDYDGDGIIDEIYEPEYSDGGSGVSE